MEKLEANSLTDAQSAAFLQRVNANIQALDATPTVDDYIREFGEERVEIKGNDYEVKHRNRDGSPDLRSRHLAAEMLHDRWKYEQRAAAVTAGTDYGDRPSMEQCQRYLNLVDPHGRAERTYAGLRWRKVGKDWRIQ